jgi:Zn-dependent protease with chaperone function
VEGHDYRRLVAAYELDSRDDPRRFALTTAAMAAFGYAAIVATLAGAGAGLGWGLVQLLQGRVRGWKVMLVIACASLLVSLLRALWLRQREPEGLAITHREAPRLFELIDKVRRRTGAPRPDRVLIDGDLNAAVVQQPRLGLLGWHRNTLILGLPLMMGLDTKQLAAVIAHEFGHLRGAHGKLGAWVYRTRRSWFMLATSRERAGLGGSVADLALAFFFRHFFPRFNARAFVLSRQQEYEADRAAHEIVGARPAAEGLLAIELQARYLHENFWPMVWRRAAQVASPAEERPYRAMRRALHGVLTHQKAGLWLKEALKRLPDLSDTHPSLRDRLEFADVPARLPAPAKLSAADALLRESLSAWISLLDRRWREEVAASWSDRHRYARAQRALMEELARALAAGPLEPDDHLLWARAARSLDGEAAEVSVLRRMLQDHAEHLGARYELGITLIDADDQQLNEEGAALLRGVAEAGNHPWTLPAAQRFEAWLQVRERFDELKTWRTKLARFEEQTGAAWEALNDFDGPQHFEPHGLGRRALRPLEDLLRGEKAAGRAYVLRKTAEAAPGWRFCIVVVERSKVIGQPDAQTWWMELRERIDLPCPFMVIDMAHPYWSDSARAPLLAQMLAVPQACVWSGRRT